jgi:hypothetical protein
MRAATENQPLLLLPQQTVRNTDNVNTDVEQPQLRNQPAHLLAAQPVLLGQQQRRQGRPILERIPKLQIRKNCLVLAVVCAFFGFAAQAVETILWDAYLTEDLHNHITFNLLDWLNLWLLDILILTCSICICFMTGGNTGNMCVILTAYLIQPIIFVASFGAVIILLGPLLIIATLLYLLLFINYSQYRYYKLFNRPAQYGLLVVIMLRLVAERWLGGEMDPKFLFVMQLVLQVAAVHLGIVFNIPVRMNRWLADRFDYGVHTDFLGDTTTAGRRLDPILRTLNGREVVNAEVAIFGNQSNPSAPCLLKAMADINSEEARQQLRMMLRDNRRTVNEIVINGLSLDMKLALRLYTAARPFKLYESFNMPFQQQVRTVESTRHCWPFMALLIAAIRALAVADGGAYVYRGTVYRGQYIDANNQAMRTKWDNHETYFAVGGHDRDPTVLTFAPVTSTSIQRNFAMEHVNEYVIEHVTNGMGNDVPYKLLYVFEGIEGVRIDQLSHYPEEEEVIWCPPTRFVVTAATKTADGWLIIHLRPFVFESEEDKRSFTYHSLADGVISVVG